MRWLRLTWDRRSANGLLRQYMSKQTNLNVYFQVQLSKIARELNGRPRKTLGYKTPAEVFNEALH